jgi:hypothetical protein
MSDQSIIEEQRRLAGLSEAVIPSSDKTVEDEDEPPLWRLQWSHADDFDPNGDFGREVEHVAREMRDIDSYIESNLLKPISALRRQEPGIYDPAENEVKVVVAGIAAASRALEDNWTNLRVLLKDHGKEIGTQMRAVVLAEYEKWKAGKGKR